MTSSVGEQLRGTAASPGVAVGAPWRWVPEESDGEPVPLDEAVRRAAAELERLAASLRAGEQDDEAGILEAQALMAGDPELVDRARQLVEEGTPAPEAIRAAGAAAAASLEQLDDELLASRAVDVRDVAERIARIAGGGAAPHLDRRSVVVALDLPPSVTTELDRSLLAGMALEGGSRTAHAAILARALRIPAVVGIEGLLERSAGAEELLVDGEAGIVILDPSPAEREERRAAAARSARSAEEELERPLATSDGVRVMLGANLAEPEEAADAVEAGAEAVGLFRTEFLFMRRRTAPSEAEQADAYASVLQAFGERPVVIRLLDVGGDKQLPYLGIPAEANPQLGVRGIRLGERDPELVRTQIRAILAASERTGRGAWIMAPMVADLDDVALLHELVAAASAGRALPQPPRVGIMVEVPAAVTLAERIAAEVDFMSIGTNDLTQYLLAADRTNPALGGRQDPLHPAVLRAVGATIAAGHAAGISVAVCGEMAGDPAGAVALVGLGIDELSMDPVAFGPVKRALRALTRGAAADAVRAAMEARSAAEARGIIQRSIAS